MEYYYYKQLIVLQHVTTLNRRLYNNIYNYLIFVGAWYEYMYIIQ